MINQTISHYKIIEKLGEGGMGEVYLAEATELDRKVALKFLPPQYTSDAELNKRFRREAKAAAALNHPNIVTVHEIGEHEGRAFIAMEYVEGESLRERVSGGRFSVDSAGVCQVLIFVYKKKLVVVDGFSFFFFFFATFFFFFFLLWIAVDKRG